MCVRRTWFGPIFVIAIWLNIKKDQIASQSTELCWQGPSVCECTHSRLCWIQNPTWLRQAPDWKMTQWVWLWQQPLCVGDYLHSITDDVFSLQLFHSNSLNYQIALAARCNLAPNFNSVSKHSSIRPLWLKIFFLKLP